MDQVPIYTMEKPGFQQLIKQLNPRYALPSRNHFMSSEIPELYNTTKQTVLQQLQGNLCFSCTTDLWTSRAASSFMAVTLQFYYRVLGHAELVSGLCWATFRAYRRQLKGGFGGHSTGNMEAGYN